MVTDHESPDKDGKGKAVITMGPLKQEGMRSGQEPGMSVYNKPMKRYFQQIPKDTSAHTDKPGFSSVTQLTQQ